jgi:uncharacterized repeat protein (TIGR02543 family)
MKNFFGRMSIGGVVLAIAIAVAGCVQPTDTQKTYTVTFKLEGGTIDGSAVVQVTGILPGGTIPLPENPKKVLYVFGGWYTDNSTFANAFTSATEVYENITVYAKWTERYTGLSVPDTGLPVIVIFTAGEAAITSKEDYVNADISIVDSQNPSNNLETVSGVRGRGNSTWGYPKKPYRLKFDKKQSLFGYEPAKSWVLLANYQDPTLLMNDVAFELGRRMDLPYTNHAVPVEVVLNGQHIGSYTLTEQVQVGKGRVDIDDRQGWFVELDSYYDEDPKFRSTHYQLPVMIKSPEDLSDAEYDFVRADINALDEALHSDSFPASGYCEMIDMDTFVDFLLVNEIVGNGELGHPKSAYMYKDKNGKISMGPLWDFDWAFNYNPDTKLYFTSYEYHSGKHPFFLRLFDDPVFTAKYKERWNLHYPAVAVISAFVDEEASRLQKSQTQNFIIWPWAGGVVDYDWQIACMKGWLNERIAYLNREINQM